MKKSRKITLLVLSIVTLAFFAGSMILFFLLPTILEADGMLGLNFTLVKETYIYTFDKTKVVQLTENYKPEQFALTISILQLVLTGLVFIALVLGIVNAATKKRPVSILFPLLFALVGFDGALMIALGGYYLEAFKSLSEYPEFAGKAVLILLFVILAILAFVLGLAVYILSMIFVGKTAKEKANLEEEVSVIADESGDPEAVQEGDELDYAAPEALAAPVVEPEPVQPQPEEAPEIEPEPEPQKVEVNVNQGAGLDQASLATLLREVVRDIVRDEIARNNVNQPQQQPQQAQPQTITGATFGGPLVVQYFNGAINPVGAPQEEKKVEEQPAPVEEKKEEPAPVEEPVVEEVPAEEAPVEEPAPEVVPEPVAEPVKEVKEAPKYERLTFTERLLQSEQDVHDLYNEVKNEILSWGVKSRISANGDTFRLHKKMYVRITVAGKALKLYFALDPADYANTTLPIQDASNKEMYQEIPLVFKVKSGLSLRRCKDLIRDAMEKDGLEQGQIEKINWVKELKAQAAEDAKKEKAEDAE